MLGHEPLGLKHQMYVRVRTNTEWGESYSPTRNQNMYRKSRSKRQKTRIFLVEGMKGITRTAKKCSTRKKASYHPRKRMDISNQNVEEIKCRARTICIISSKRLLVEIFGDTHIHNDKHRNVEHISLDCPAVRALDLSVLEPQLVHASLASNATFA